MFLAAGGARCLRTPHVNPAPRCCGARCPSPARTEPRPVMAHCGALRLTVRLHVCCDATVQWRGRWHAVRQMKPQVGRGSCGRLFATRIFTTASCGTASSSDAAWPGASRDHLGGNPNPLNDVRGLTVYGKGKRDEQRRARKAAMEKRKREEEERATADAAAGGGGKRKKVSQPPTAAGLVAVAQTAPASAHGGGQERERVACDRARPAGVSSASGVPEGWIGCPNFGRRFGHCMPCKVPLGDKWGSVLTPEQRFTPAMAMQQIAAQGKRVGLVIDLTRTNRYYDPIEFEQMGVPHIKIPCHGRDGPPEPEMVNEFCYRAFRFEMTKVDAASVILVHCTHGFNRTGAMICHYACRNMLGMTVENAITTFASVRPPGIYKEPYVSSLFRYYHEDRPPALVTPPTPAWKTDDAAEQAGGRTFIVPPDDIFGPDNKEYAATPLHSPVTLPELPAGPYAAPFSEWRGAKSGASLGLPAPVDDDGTAAEGGVAQGGAMGATAPEGTISHEDEIGETVPADQVADLRGVIHQLMGSERANTSTFPGSQPVSLDSENLAMLGDAEYRVTWKADGTRFMLLLMLDGTYLIDRRFQFRRVQMWFPLHAQRHNVSLLDGEMVVDVDIATGTATRRYLAYDIMCINKQPVFQLPFTKRFELIESEVVNPKRQLETKMMAMPSGTKGRYLANEEPFRIRRKGFWPLDQSRKVHEIGATLSHESDGLIFQPASVPYACFTCRELLKWKPADMNSVDFYLSAEPGQEPRIAVGGNSANQLIFQEDAKLSMPPGVDPTQYHGFIVECAWDKVMRTWTFMRTRPDKDTPNHLSTFQRVWHSIEDNITENKLLTAIAAMCEAKKRAGAEGVPPQGSQ